ncbi:hypothetical protein BaRGS_00036661 [Batillaria attramentaria]|uniref:Methyltransferase FkbM domain-containing protein n=1 Tax=Batillaria attramentaria TaxID=370345 RepID=A0ABD0JCF5_9CAEN
MARTVYRPLLNVLFLIVFLYVILHSMRQAWPWKVRIRPTPDDVPNDHSKYESPHVTSDQTQKVTSDQPSDVISDQPGNVISDQTQKVTSDQPSNVISDQPGNVTSEQPQQVTSGQPSNVISDQPQQVTSDQARNVTAGELRHAASDVSRHVISDSLVTTGSSRVNIFVSAENSCKYLFPFTIKGRGQTRICTYDPNEDREISLAIQRRHSYEPEINSVLKIMDNDFKKQASKPNPTRISLVDAGCNLGTFSLSAAYAGYDVLAIDAMNSSLQLLATSLRLAGLTSRVKLIHNALWDKHETLTVHVRYPNNIGGSFVGQDNDEKYRKTVVQTVCLNDLVPFVPTPRVFLKMDIELSESKALRCAEEFFAKVDVPYILMEWAYKNKGREQEGEFIIKYLTGRGYLPYRGIKPMQALPANDGSHWPRNVWWII